MTGVIRKVGMPEGASRACTGRSCRYGIHLALFWAIILIAPSAGCSGSRELTRSRAGDLIRDSADFRRPVSVALPGKREQPTRAQSTDEPEVAARGRAFDEYARSHVEMAVFRHLGLIDFRAALVEVPSPEHEWWRFGVESVLTEKGEREAAEESEGKGREGIVISRRELIEVMGLATPAAGTARAEFTWKEVPTPTGEAFDPMTDAYRGLPEWIRRGMAGPASGMGKGLERKYGVPRKGTALLQLYDDGWRVQHIQF